MTRAVSAEPGERAPALARRRLTTFEASAEIGLGFQPARQRQAERSSHVDRGEPTRCRPAHHDANVVGQLATHSRSGRRLPRSYLGWDDEQHEIASPERHVGGASNWRGRSATTRSHTRAAAASTLAIASARMSSGSPRSKDSTASSPTRGNAAAATRRRFGRSRPRCRTSANPLRAHHRRADPHRHPKDPHRRASPGVRLAWPLSRARRRACSHPLLHVHRSRRWSAPRTAVSTASAIRATSQVSASGSTATCSAPTSIARFHMSPSSRSRPTNTTPSRRRIDARPTAIELIADHDEGASTTPIAPDRTCATSMSTPAAAPSRSTSSSSSGSAVTSSGR